MRILIDIDGTLGYRNEQQFVSVANQTLRLGIPEERLRTLTSETLRSTPEVSAYRERVGAEHCARALGWIDFQRNVLAALVPFVGAAEGVHRLAALAPISYATARYSSESPERSLVMAEATHAWLATQGFPNPKAVLFCAGVRQKVECIVDLCTESEVLLIDDQWQRMLPLISHRDRDPRLTLVAYGARRMPEDTTGLRVLLLPSWQQLEELITCLRGKEGNPC